MNSLFDVLLDKPLPDLMVRGLLFVLFTFHLLFVLFTIGTAILGVFYFAQTHWRGRQTSLRWARDILDTFIAHKSLAVVLGVGPLLLIQVGFTVPFFTATNLLGPFWLLIIGLLIVAFLLLDFLHHGLEKQPYLKLGYAVVGLSFLLVVPGIFVAALTTMENPDQWVTMVRNNYRLPRSLAVHWLFRYLHIVGAAVVFGGAFHYFFSGEEQIQKKKILLKWIMAGLLVQFVLGILLYISLPVRPDLVMIGFMVMGIIAASGLLWQVFNRRALRLTFAVPTLLLILIPMLAARQMHQERQVLPVLNQIQANAEAYQQVIEPYTPAGLSRYEADLYDSYEQGQAIYEQSCAFCHSVQPGSSRIVGDIVLTTPPEVLGAVRSNRQYIYRHLREGVPGTAMPYFSFFTRDKLDGLISYMDGKFRILATPEPLPVEVPEAVRQEAGQVFATTCSTCHGPGGASNTEFSRGFAPQPPNFQEFTLSPQRSFEVITHGYRGTMMGSFRELPAELRWGLVAVVRDFYIPPNSQ